MKQQPKTAEKASTRKLPWYLQRNGTTTDEKENDEPSHEKGRLRSSATRSSKDKVTGDNSVANAKSKTKGPSKRKQIKKGSTKKSTQKNVLNDVILSGDDGNQKRPSLRDRSNISKKSSGSSDPLINTQTKKSQLDENILDTNETWDSQNEEDNSDEDVHSSEDNLSLDGDDYDEDSDDEGSESDIGQGELNDLLPKNDEDVLYKAVNTKSVSSYITVSH